MATSIEEREKEFNLIDSNNNGIITFGEWYRYFESKPEVTQGMSKAQIRTLFRVYDTQGEESGIDFEEYCVFMKEILDPIREKKKG